MQCVGFQFVAWWCAKHFCACCLADGLGGVLLLQLCRRGSLAHCEGTFIDPSVHIIRLSIMGNSLAPVIVRSRLVWKFMALQVAMTMTLMTHQWSWNLIVILFLTHNCEEQGPVPYPGTQTWSLVCFGNDHCGNISLSHERWWEETTGHPGRWIGQSSR